MFSLVTPFSSDLILWSNISTYNYRFKIVHSLCRLGVTYSSCDDDVIELSFRGGTKRYYRRHRVLEFDPDRKRMSVIVEDKSDGIIVCFPVCNGNLKFAQHTLDI